MHYLIKKAIKRGWLEAEVTMALADVAEDHVIAIATERPKAQLFLVKNS